MPDPIQTAQQRAVWGGAAPGPKPPTPSARSRPVSGQVARPGAGRRALGRFATGMGGLAPLFGLSALLSLASTPAQAANTDQLLRLLGQGACPNCKLQDADLVHASLRDANLRGAQLQRANLSGALLDGAQLGGADLSFTSLQGASLRGADLRGARLEGTDLRESDLSGARLDAGALSRSHWDRAKGLADGSLDYADLHNAGVEASLAGNAPEAERLFGAALRQRPDAALTWLARGMSRKEQGKNALAAQDFGYAATLYTQSGDALTAEKLRQASDALLDSPKQNKGGNGMGSQILSGAMSAIQALAPLAVKFLAPMAF
ncbi:MAG: pentapeptide repeat-containing protein [Cyanobium sp.]